MTARLPEQHESLWMPVASPAIWSAHFLLSYGTVAVWCAKFAAPDDDSASAQLAIAVYTALALAAVLPIAYGGYKRHRLEGGREPHGADLPEDRHRFLGFATMLLSGLSTIAILYTALAAALVGSCR